MMESSTVARLVQKLDQDPALNSKDLYKVLVTIRTKHMNQEEILLKEGLFDYFGVCLCFYRGYRDPVLVISSLLSHSLLRVPCQGKSRSNNRALKGL